MAVNYLTSIKRPCLKVKLGGQFAVIEVKGLSLFLKPDLWMRTFWNLKLQFRCYVFKMVPTTVFKSLEVMNEGAQAVSKKL